MKLATVRRGADTHAAIIHTHHAELLDVRDVGALLAHGWDGSEDPGAARTGERVGLDDVVLDAPVLRPEKIICVGLNYRDHAGEADLALPDHPTLFAKYWRSLLGPRDDLRLPVASNAVDWEAELGIVIGRRGRSIPVSDAPAAIAGYTVVNDISMRDWQLRTSQFLQGKTFEQCTPVGPVLITPDEVDHARDLAIGCDVNGEQMQRSSTASMIFSPAQLVSYISQIITLVPGDLIACGTPSGIGGLQDPPRFLTDGDVVRTWIEGIGELSNRCVAHP